MTEIGRYQERLEGFNLSEKTITEYLSHFKRLFKLIGDNPFDEMIADAYLKDNPNSVAMAFLNDYISWKKLPIRLGKRIVKRKPEINRVVITPDELEKLGDYIYDRYGLKYFLMLNLAYHCALRRKETIGLNYNQLKEDVSSWDRERPMRLKIRKETAKRKKPRIVIVPNNIAQLLVVFVRTSFKQIVSSEHKNNVFRIGERRWNKVFRDSCLEVLKRPQSTHDLRFSKATSWYLDQGLDILTIKNLLGHESIATTQVYIDKSQEPALRQLEKIYEKT